MPPRSNTAPNGVSPARRGWLARPVARARAVPLLLAALIGLSGTAPLRAAEPPIRWSSGGAVWSTSQSAFDTFLRTGEITDRGLAAGLAASGWPVDQLRAALSKTYSVDFLAVSRFLYSDAGERFLRRATTSYVPYDAKHSTAVQALRSAILRDATDGTISSVGIMRALPTAFRLSGPGSPSGGEQPICAPGRCKSGTPQCTSLLSWYAFLPACIQARQVTERSSLKAVPGAP